MFIMSTLKECEYMLKKGGVGIYSTISQLIEAQKSSIAKIKWLHAENVILQSKLTQNSTEPGSSGSLAKENFLLKSKNARLKKQVEDLKDKMITDQRTANERVDKPLKAFFAP